MSILLRCYQVKGVLDLEGQKEIREAMFYQFFSFRTIFFDDSDVQVSLMSIFDSRLKTSIGKGWPFHVLNAEHHPWPGSVGGQRKDRHE